MRKTYLTISVFALVLAGIPLGARGDNTSYEFPIGYTLDQITGTVLVLPKGAAKPEKAEEDQTVQVGDEIITQANSQVSLTLDENTMLQVSADSYLVVGDLSRKNQTSFVSRLKLAAGRVLSQVEKLGSSHSVFEIEAGGVVCGVRGTAFEVAKQGESVQTNTFEGTVEMSKDQMSQKVTAGKHSEFALDQGLFTIQRVVSAREEARYENWKKYRDLMAQRERERKDALKAFHALPVPEKSQLWQELQKIRDIDRFKVLRRMMREKNLKDRLKVIDDASHARADALKGREDTARRAQEERERNLKALKKKPEE